MIGCGGTMMMEKYAAADTMWVLIGAFMVFFMQPGFAMVETGFTLSLIHISEPTRH